jgi:uncharacterized protein (TIGR03435 family)
MRTAILILFAAGGALAQEKARPAFEAASVKVNTSDSGSRSSHSSKGQILISNYSMKLLLQRAYKAKPQQIDGPRWIETESYDIAAKYPPDTKDEDRDLMLLTLLEDRFKLAVHRESREQEGYAMVVAKGGFKLKPVEPGTGGGTNSNSDGKAVNFGATKTYMAGLADYLTRLMDGIVFDKTGIAGVYDFQMKWTRDERDDSMPTLSGALRDVLGLRLQPEKVPVEVIVIDHLERSPVE